MSTIERYQCKALHLKSCISNELTHVHVQTLVVHQCQRTKKNRRPAKCGACYEDTRATPGVKQNKPPFLPADMYIFNCNRYALLQLALDFFKTAIAHSKASTSQNCQHGSCRSRFSLSYAQRLLLACLHSMWRCPLRAQRQNDQHEACRSWSSLGNLSIPQGMPSMSGH